MCKTWVRWYHGTSTLAGKGDDRLLLVELAVFMVMRTAKENQTHIGPESRVKKAATACFGLFVFASCSSYIPPESKTLVHVCTREQFRLVDPQ